MIKDLKEITKMLEELEKIVAKNDLKNIVEKRLNEALNEPVSISVKKNKNGKAEVKMDGERLAVLITLAGLEQTILRNTDTPVEIWEFIKERVGSMEVDNG